jgi:uncharacterized protein YegP (UPF0339 family)
MRAKRITIYKDKAGEWRFKVQGANWKTIAVSEEGYKGFEWTKYKATRLFPDAEEIIVK